MNLIKNANEEFRNKNYKKALELYEIASQELESDSFKFNIDLCKNKLNYNQKANFEVVNEKKILKAINKNPLNNYFDNIYVVNLKHQVADRLKVSNHLRYHGVDFEIFEATNGYVGEPLEKWNEYKEKPIGNLKRFPHYNEREKKHRRHFLESSGAIGYIYTYLKILKDAKKNAYKRFLILEDDIILDNDFNEKFKNFIESIDDDWKVLHLGASQYGWKSVNIQEAIKKRHYIARQMDTKGSYSIAFDLSIVDELIELQSAFEAPFDHIPMSEIYERHLGKCFVSFPYIVMPDVSESTIRGKRNQYEHSKRMKWNIENYDYPLDKPSIAIIITSIKNLKYINNFSNINKLPFSYALFFNTNDGLRPLHNKELLSLEFNMINPIDYSAIKNEYEYIGSMNDNSILTENDIVKFIEYKIGLTTVNTTNLSDFSSNEKKIVKDRASVIVPTFKRSKNLKLALESVVKQDYKDIELLVISDNGKDSKYNNETRKIIDSLKNTNPNCKVILIEHSVNRNGSAARNTGISNSTGEYISFLDDDDMYLPGRLSKTIAVLKNERKTIGAVYCGFLGWNSPKNDLNRYQTGDLTLEILLLEYKKHYLHTNTATYRRDAVLFLNGFDESYRRHQDLEFNLRFFEKYEISACKEALVRLNPEPSDVSNKAFNTVMLELKFKFLSQFKYLIEKYPAYIQYQIYELHQNEALKYVKEKDKALEFYKINFKDYHIQMLMKLAYSLNPKIMKILDTSSNKKLHQKNEIGFYRILGNNMPFLQSDEQLFSNIVKIVEEESNFVTADKYFVINKIINNTFREKIIKYFNNNDIKYLEIEFDIEKFKKIGYSFSNIPDASIWFSNLDEWNRLVAQTEIREFKNVYVMNNNGARNFALRHGKELYNWTMPWDGNCFMSDIDYKELEITFENSKNQKYIITPMERVIDNKSVNKAIESKNAIEEPQISFRNDSNEEFSEARAYGNQPKVELFKRLGIQGKWDDWHNLSPWIKLDFKKSNETDMYSNSSAVFRLSSNNLDATINPNQRNIKRKKGIISFIDQVEVNFIEGNTRKLKYKVKFPEKFKGYIDNKEIKEYNNKLIWAHKQKSLSEKTIKYNKLMTETLFSMSNTSKNTSEKFGSTIILFSHKFLDESKLILNEDTKLFIDGQYQTVYAKLDLTKVDTLKGTMTNVVVALLLQLNKGDFVSAVQLKLELSMLLYFYISKREELNFQDDKDLISMKRIINVLVKEIFDYDILRDIKNNINHPIKNSLNE